MYKPGQYLKRAFSGEDINTREALGAIGEGLAGLVLTLSGGSMLSPSPANAQSKANAAVPKRLTIDEYYQQARPAEHIMPGARIGDYFVSLKNPGFGFLNGEWTDYYIANKDGKGDLMDSYFSQIDGKPIKYGGHQIFFQYDKFKEFNEVNHHDFKDVVLFDSGIAMFSFRDKSKKVLIPTGSEVVAQIKDLW